MWSWVDAPRCRGRWRLHAGIGISVTDRIGAVPLDHTVLGATLEDRITPNGGAQPAFTDDSTAPDALTSAGAYKVVFLAFPMEAYGSAAQKADLMTRVFAFFGP